MRCVLTTECFDAATLPEAGPALHSHPCWSATTTLAIRCGAQGAGTVDARFSPHSYEARLRARSFCQSHPCGPLRHALRPRDWNCRQFEPAPSLQRQGVLSEAVNASPGTKEASPIVHRLKQGHQPKKQTAMEPPAQASATEKGGERGFALRHAPWFQRRRPGS